MSVHGNRGVNHFVSPKPKAKVPDTGKELREKQQKAKGVNTESKADFYKSIGYGEPEPVVETKDKATGDFMRLLVEELRNQNPLNPTEGKEFVAQLAQLALVEETKSMNKNMQGMTDSVRSNRIMEATSMIGKSMKVRTNKMQLVSHEENGALQGEMVKGAIKIPMLKVDESRIFGIKMEIRNNKGEVVYKQEWDDKSKLLKPGTDFPIEWNGTDPDTHVRKLDHTGRPIADGDYKVYAKMLVSKKGGGSEWKDVDTAISTKVNGVSINDKGDIEFTATGIGSISLDKVREIAEPEAISPLVEQAARLQQAAADAAAVAQQELHGQ